MENDELEAVGEALLILSEAAPLSRPLFGERYARAAALVADVLRRLPATGGGAPGKRLLASLSRGLHILLPLLLIREYSKEKGIGSASPSIEQEG